VDSKKEKEGVIKRERKVGEESRREAKRLRFLRQ
jgi:hypothetical protein